MSGIGEEQIGGAASGQAAADTDEETGADGAADGDQLDLTVAEMTVQLALVIDFADGGAALRTLLTDSRGLVDGLPREI